MLKNVYNLFKFKLFFPAPISKVCPNPYGATENRPLTSAALRYQLKGAHFLDEEAFADYRLKSAPIKAENLISLAEQIRIHISRKRGSFPPGGTFSGFSRQILDLDFPGTRQIASGCLASITATTGPLESLRFVLSGPKFSVQLSLIWT